MCYYASFESVHPLTSAASQAIAVHSGRPQKTDHPPCAVIIEAKYLELLRRGYEVTVGRTGDKEIDFVCDKRGEKLYVQVTYLLASEETVNREFGAYDSIRDNFPKYVVSLDEFDMSRNGIKHRNIRDFLLAEEWN